MRMPVDHSDDANALGNENLSRVDARREPMGHRQLSQGGRQLSKLLLKLQDFAANNVLIEQGVQRASGKPNR